MSEEALRELFEKAIALPSRERAAFLNEACGDDEPLRTEVEALVAADADAHQDTFWRHTAVRHEALATKGVQAAPGEEIGRYRLMEVIGRGGMGAVYRAERIDAEYEQSVAIKLLDVVFRSADAIAHFRAERQILASLEHPNITRLLDGGTRLDGLPYLVMEYVEGVSPNEYCRTHDLPLPQRLMLFRQICAAVHFAHQHMIIHRDLKPANVLVTEEGIPKLLDFGIAKVLTVDPLRQAEALTEPGMQKLTARYASPEQIRGEAVTTASDIYSLGVMLYELLSGHSPYGDPDQPTHMILHAVCEGEPAKPSAWAPKLKGDLDRIILRAMQKLPGQRYASVDQFSEDLLRHLEGRPVLARGEAPLYLAAKFVRRNRVAVVAAALLLCTLVGGLVEVSLARARAERRFNDVQRLAHAVMFDYADAIDRLPGATPVRARLVQDALTYLDDLSREADTPQLQREIVDAYVHVSNVQGNEYENNLGDTTAALASAHKAVNAAEKMLRRDRSQAASSSAASAFSTEGSLLYSTGDLHGADTAYQRAVGLYREVARVAPQDLDNQIALSTCLRHLGDLYGGYGFANLGRRAEGLAFYEEAKSVTDGLLSRFPGNREVTKENYKILLPLSAAEVAAGRSKEATRDLSEAVRSIATVSEAEPQDVNVQVERALAESRLGMMLLDNLKAEEAVRHLAYAGGLLQTLSSGDSSNTIYRRGLSVVEGQWAAALRGSGHIAEAIRHNERALQLAAALGKDAPSSAQYRLDVGISQRKLAEALLAGHKPAEALAHLEEAVKILCPRDLAAANSNLQANCGRARLAEGNAHRMLNHRGAAMTAYREAEQIAGAVSRADTTNAIFRSDLARTQTALAAPLADDGHKADARDLYQQALGNWSFLRTTGSLSGEDAQRSELTQQSLAKLPSSH